MPALSPRVMSKEALAAIKIKMDRLALLEMREECQESLRAFVEYAWPHVDPSPFMANWAIDAVCLPYDTKITTNEGIKDIGWIVETKWQGKVLSYNHKANRLEWKLILSHMKSIGKPLVKVKTNKGSLTATCNHPVFVDGVGYIRADEIKSGDKLFGSDKEGSKTRISKELYGLWKTILQTTVGKGKKILFNALLQQDKRKTPQKDLSILRRAKGLGAEYQVLSEMFGKAAKAWSILQVRLVWGKRGLALPWSLQPNLETAWRILQPEMFWFSNKGEKSSSIYKREQPRIIPAGILDDEVSNKTPRKSSLFSLPRIWRLGYPSYRSKQNKQQSMEFGNSMRGMPYVSARAYVRKLGFKRSYQISPEVVRHVSKETWLPDAVYNIEVKDNHNYFAEAVLVHNCDHLEAVMLGQIPNLLINIPPRCAKTTIVSIMFPAWIWLRYTSSLVSPLSGPQVKFLCASYSDKLSLLSSNAFRRLVKSEWYSGLYPELAFMRDQDAKGHMDNNQRGSRQSTSIGGSLLGLGGDILIGDDLNNTETEKLVETGAERAKAVAFWNEFRSTRRNDPRPGMSAVINVQQRTNEGDVSGSWLDTEDDVCHLMIPMRHDPLRHNVTIVLPQYDDKEPWEDPRYIESEDLMWPERFNEFAVAGLEKALGPYMASGRLQQIPSPKGGGIIQRDYWLPWDEHEARKYGLEWHAGLREFPDMELVVASLDTAYKEKEENDYNAFTIWGIFLDQARNRRAMLMFAWMKRLPLNGKVITAFPNELKVNFEKRMKDNWGLVDYIADGCKRYKVKRLLIEDKSRGHDVANEIRRLHTRENWGVQLVNPVGDKVSRAHSVVPLFTDDCIYAPAQNGQFIRWADQVVTQCLIAGTKIITDRGIVNIENIQLGDRVLTHKGRFRPVLNLFMQKKKDFVRIEGKALDLVTITPEHPFYAVHMDSARKVVKETDWIDAKDIQSRIYKEVIRKGKIYSEAYPSPCHALTLPKIRRECPIDRIDLRDWAMLPKGKKYQFVEDDTTVSSTHGRIQSVKWDQELDNRFGRFLGLFLAEGCARRSNVSWSFNEKEVELIKEITSFIKERIGTGVFYDHYSQSATIVYTCIPLVESFFREFGNYCHDKKIPNWVWNAPDEFIEGLISGWYDGDGSDYKNEKKEVVGLTGTTISLSLAWGMRLLLLRLGRKATIFVGKEGGVETLFDGRQCNTSKSYMVNYLFNPANDGAAKMLDDFAAYSVMRATVLEQEHDVYNFEVAEDNSYCTTGGLVHNCAKFPKDIHDDLVDSVTQFLNWARENEILVRADEASAYMEEQATFKHKTQSVAEQYGV